jgi:hypothetical protein
MQFSETTTNTGIIQAIEANLFGDTPYGKVSGDSDRLQMFTNWINEGFRKYFEIVTKMDIPWSYGDYNFTTYGIAQRDIVSGQRDYQFDPSFIKILDVSVTNSAGTAVELLQLSPEEYAYSRQNTQDYYGTNAVPTHFALVENSIFLYPTPNYTSTNAITVKFQRPPNYFVYTDTTKEPGFTDTHHPYLIAYASWKYSQTRTVPNAVSFRDEVSEFEKVTIPNFYRTRQKYVKPSFTPNYQNNR